ncbi:hypothetical protein B0J13DRAFT_490591 [Dactylonectria estremocensis]|uniref:Uncharacterized protein n=1 Tax=Dactylonectria estremocensis TaxID=1079267 RepID=A0A9P9JHU7_9HYPO|nr:hypothetical protein B0J13DRAFT_490591 [Dactylonectria estremocensis]
MQESSRKDTAVSNPVSSLNHTSRWLAGDLFAAAISATLVAPTVTIIDRAMVEKVSANQPLLRGLRTHSVSALLNPGQLCFSRPFGMVWALYAATYAVANGSETLANEFEMAAVGTVTFVSTMLVNVPMGVWKDVSFARWYSLDAATGKQLSTQRVKVPRAATGTFLLRDAVTIFGSFTMAPALSAIIPDTLTSNAHAKLMVTQLTVPVLSQLGATPLHLLGLDFYNRRQASMSERVTQIKRDLPSATLVRCLRIIPAFGFGCIANMESRSYFHKLFESL